MKKAIRVIGIVISALMISGLCIYGTDQDKNPLREKNFYENSLHFTNKGLEYWYSKEQGGLEKITNIPFSELPCSRCHVRSCDTCHRKDVDGKPTYSLEPTRAQEVCQNCHALESLDKARKNPEDPTVDVHFRKGMKCLDCHTAREVHGDGTPYNSMQDPGALDTRCDKCHSQISKSPSHEVHKGKLDCNACHATEMTSCFNCHFDTRLKEGKSVSIPLKNLHFLINHEGKVTLANFHTYVYQNKTMITFAPGFTHSVAKAGRKCDECHDTQIIKDIKKNKFYPVVFDKGEVKNVTGMVPVLEGVKWNFVYLNYENGKWVLIDNPAEPLINYSGYSGPLTREQFDRLEKPAQFKGTDNTRADKSERPGRS